MFYMRLGPFVGINVFRQPGTLCLVCSPSGLSSEVLLEDVESSVDDEPPSAGAAVDDDPAAAPSSAGAAVVDDAAAGS